MQLYYGPYAFLPNSVWFTISKRPIVGRTGRRNFVDENWFINGRVQGANTAAVVVQVAALEDALTDGNNLVFSTYHQLLSADCTEGTHVRDFKWTSGYDGVRGSGAELVFRRTFQLVIGGTKSVTSDTDIADYWEEVSGYGTGGPIIVPVGSLSGTVQPQQPQAHSFFTSWQRGRATGLTATPAAATPIWATTAGVYYFPETFGGGISTPQKWGINQNTMFSINWSYRAWSPTIPMVASPIPF